jgi:phosphatidylglycerophosphate synthase
MKDPRIEEPVDLIFYRPLAYLFVLVFKRTSITPNQISLISMAVGVLSSYFLAFGDRRSMLIGGCLYGLSNVIDCSDGMVARIKKNGSKTGRIVDGSVDYIVGITIAFGFGSGLVHGCENRGFALPLHPWLLIALATVSMIIHAILTDKYRSLFESHVYGKFINPQNEVKEFEQEYKRMEKEGGSQLDRFLVRSYLGYCRLQTTNCRKPFRRIRPELYARYNSLMVMLWNLIGPAMHITMLVIATVLYKPMIFFWYAVVWANLWMFVLYPIQMIINRKLHKHAEYCVLIS